MTAGAALKAALAADHTHAEPAVPGKIWALPTAGIGALLAQVPALLSFGRVELQDVPCLGFLAEAAGVAGMPDITEHDGWRGWLAAGKPV